MILTLLLGPILFSGARAFAEDEAPLRRKFGLGLTYLGGSLRYGFLKSWTAEFHFYYDKATADNGDVTANVVGARVYRFFKAGQKLQPYAGLEGDYVSAKLKDGGSYGGGSLDYSASGSALGGFGGVEYYFLKRLSISLDAGPYFVSLKEKQTSLKDSGVDFVINTSVNFYFF